MKKKKYLYHKCLSGLPGSEERFTKKNSAALKTYEGIDAKKLKEHLVLFSERNFPVAEEAGLKMAIHPDDPPYPILGLPRIVSTEKDAQELFDAAPSPANGFCFCTGSFGVRADNDLVGNDSKIGRSYSFYSFAKHKKR